MATLHPDKKPIKWQPSVDSKFFIDKKIRIQFHNLNPILQYTN